MRYFLSLILILLLFTPLCPDANSEEIEGLFDQLAELNLSRNGYTLGKMLTDTQKKTAHKHPVKMENPKIYKFQDGDLFIIAEKETDRVVILYKEYDPVSRDKIQEVVGDLFLDFGDPTIFAHDKVIYWAFGPKGKLSEKDYNKIKKEKGKLDVLATLKFTSTLKIMEKGDAKAPGSMYYIISSPAVLKIISDHP